ncbi:MAG: hypothetical protein LLF92_04570 [Planctomycetaceae bacterium]|nr:hypothetical protein [Planctomycetaceae bacterium]
MKLLLKKLSISIEHLKCLDEVFLKHNEEYKRINSILNSVEFKPIYEEISRELYAGGKTAAQSQIRLNRQMILGDVIEYIFSGRAYYYAAKSDQNLKKFYKLILYSVNQMLLYDTITVNPKLRKYYIQRLERKINNKVLFEKEGDKALAKTIKDSNIKIWQKGWTTAIDDFIDSILPKTLGAPKELIVFAEFIRLQIGIIIPLLLIQRIFGNKNPIAPPDFLILKGNKEIYGIEVGYKKELQSREFSIRTSIPTFAVDLKNNMHNRCPKCGENILYCDIVIENFSNGTLDNILASRNDKSRVYCNECTRFNNGKCKYSNYYGWVEGKNFNQQPLEAKAGRHYHTCCVKDDHYMYRRTPRKIFENHLKDFFAQIPEIDGIENLKDR